MADGSGVEVFALVLVLALGIFLQLAVYASRYKRVPPNHAMVIFGRRATSSSGGFKVIVGGGKFILPIVETYEFLDLTPFEVQDVLEGVVEDVRGAARSLRVQVLATAGVADDPDGVRAAAKTLLRKPRDELREIVRATLEGHIRGLIASEPSPVDDSALGTTVRERAEADLSKIGLRILTTSVTRLGPSGSADSLVADVAAIRRRVEQLDARIGRLEEATRDPRRGRPPPRR